MSGIGINGGGISPAPAVRNVQSLSITSNLVTIPALKGLSIAQIREHFTLFIDGTEVLTASQTTLENSSTGTINLNTIAFNGLTGYFKQYGNP